ncbi:hypothetical protein [Achromobacter anxifer]|uniref:hypothetical protein n=1 Tax=Achromobacter anxifer TaxID=1287737 RepID=UPI0023F6D197|nr:hypothetical protein [Achromobacter anxifer]MDF8361932.1 hypothetical protein [Achromobacter anxifer]
MDTWLYSRTEAPRIFRTTAEVDAALNAGWADTPAAFDIQAPAEAAEDAEELRAKAAGLGIKVDKRWGAEKLAKAIEDHAARA